MAIQTTYPSTIRPAVVGMKVDMIPATMISRTVEAVAGLAFGKAASQGVADEGCKPFGAGDTAATYVGFAVRERSLIAEGNAFARYDSARLMTKGSIWVIAAQDVVAGSPLYLRPSNGDLQKDNTNSSVLIPNGRFDSTGVAGTLVKLRLA